MASPNIDALAAAADGATLASITPWEWHDGPTELTTRKTGAPLLARIFACGAQPEYAALQMMAALCAAEWRLPAHEPAIRGLALESRSPFRVDLALASARLLPRFVEGPWHAVRFDLEKDDPVRVAAILAARIYLRPVDLEPYTGSKVLWKRVERAIPLDYATASVFFSTPLGLYLGGSMFPKHFIREVGSIVARELKSKNIAGREQQSLAVIFKTLEDRCC